MRIKSKQIDNSGNSNQQFSLIRNVKGIGLVNIYTEQTLPIGYMAVLNSGRWAYKDFLGNVAYLVSSSELAKGVSQQIIPIQITSPERRIVAVNHTLQKSPSDIVVWNYQTKTKVRNADFQIDPSNETSRVIITFDEDQTVGDKFYVHVLRYATSNPFTGSAALPNIYTDANIEPGGSGVTLDGNHWLIQSPDNPRPAVSIQRNQAGVSSALVQQVLYDTSGLNTEIRIPFTSDVRGTGIEVVVFS